VSESGEWSGWPATLYNSYVEESTSIFSLVVLLSFPPSEVPGCCAKNEKQKETLLVCVCVCDTLALGMFLSSLSLCVEMKVAGECSSLCLHRAQAHTHSVALRLDFEEYNCLQ